MSCKQTNGCNALHCHTNGGVSCVFIVNHVKTDFVHGGRHIPVLSFNSYQDSIHFSDVTTQFAE